MHILKADRAITDDQIRGTRPVSNVRIFVHQAEHPLHIDKRLTQFTIDPPQKIQWHVKLQQVGVDHNKVTNAEMACLDVGPGHAHHHHQADGDDRPLPDIHHRKRGTRAHRHRLVALHRLIIALSLDILGIKIFDCLKIQQ